jgi:tetratricopeptide (TPR) repeat protein
VPVAAQPAWGPGWFARFRDLPTFAMNVTVIGINLGDAYRLTGNYPAAAASLEQALDLCRALGDRPGEAGALYTPGAAQELTGDFLAAAANLRQALRLSRALGDRLGEANSSPASAPCNGRQASTPRRGQASNGPWSSTVLLAPRTGRPKLILLGAIACRPGRWPRRRVPVG